MAVTKKIRGAGRKTIKKEGPTYKLETEVNEPPDELFAYLICLYGKKGIGKTSLASQAPGSHTFMWEPRRRNLRIRQQDMNQYPDEERWTAYKELQQQALDDDSVQVIINDTVDRLYEACLAGNCYDRGITSPPNDDYGATWREIKADFEETLDLIRAADKGHVLISHQTTREMTSMDGGDYTVIEPSCMPAAFKYIQAAADFAFYYGIYEGKRALYLRGIDNFIWAACGTDEHFMQPGGKEVMILEMGNSPKLAYKSLVDSFYNKLYDIAYVEETTKKLLRKKVLSK